MFSLEGDLTHLRDDLNYASVHKTVDENGNFIYLDKTELWKSDAVQIVDLEGIIKYRFEFPEELSTYQLSSFYMYNDSLFFHSTLEYPASIYHVKVDCQNYTAEVEFIRESTEIEQNLMYSVVACSPGSLIKECEPNLNILPNVVSSNEEISIPTINIYPNPASDYLIIEGNHEDKLEYRLFDVTSSLLEEGIIEKEKRIDLTAFHSGLYVLQLQNVNEVIVYKKFIINR